MAEIADKDVREDMSSKPWVVLVGGFLGSGKTTLILAAARELQQRGLRSAMVWNDQGEDLVDSNYASLSGMHSGEVTGGCFCCRLSDLIAGRDLCRAGGELYRSFGHCPPAAARVQRHLSAFAAYGAGRSNPRS
jgi:CobW/HypB/UreG, nucleotide-binding domain